MSADLSGLIQRLQVLLHDVDEEIWSVALLQECVRGALRELQTVCPHTLLIAGLDEALETNLDLEISLSPLLLQLAQKLALLQRQVQRSETFHPDPNRQSQALVSTSKQQDYQGDLERVRLYFLQRSSTTPY
jgi:hypothetical protein